MSTILVESRVPAGKSDRMRRLLNPLWVLKDLISSVYLWMLGTLWNELIRGRANEDQASNALAAVLFLLFSWVVFHFQDQPSGPGAAEDDPADAFCGRAPLGWPRDRSDSFSSVRDIRDSGGRDFLRR